MDAIVRQRTKSLNLTHLITSEFENMFQEEKLTSLNEFAEGIQHEIESFLLAGLAKHAGGEVTAEIAPVNLTKMAYQKHGFVVPHGVQSKV